jgi:predicted CopG family antitoxin
MKTINVSDATYRAIAEAAILPFRSTATRQPGGSWLVPIADDTWDALQKERLPDESDDDAVLRLIRRHRGQKPN